MEEMSLGMRLLSPKPGVWSDTRSMPGNAAKGCNAVSEFFPAINFLRDCCSVLLRAYIHVLCALNDKTTLFSSMFAWVTFTWDVSRMVFPVLSFLEAWEGGISVTRAYKVSGLY